MKDKPIVSVKEARKILGDVAITMSDEEILDVIGTLNILAKDALKTAQQQLAMKRDATDLAGLIYDIYQDKKSNNHGQDL